MVIADVDGVKVGRAPVRGRTAANSPTLLQGGRAGQVGIACEESRLFLYDIFCRAGGAVAGNTDCMVTIHSNDVVGDNLWLWRADHGAGAELERQARTRRV